MTLSFGLFLQALLLALAIYWCYEMVGRRHEHVEALRHSDEWTPKVVVVVLWLVTLFVAWYAVTTIISLAARIIDGIQKLL